MSFLLGYWALPILFILHDFEEMVFLPLWKRRSKFRALPGRLFWGNQRWFGVYGGGAGGVCYSVDCFLCVFVDAR